MEINELALFAGIGGGILAGKLLGWSTVCGVEKDEYCASILVKRQNEGILPPFPIWSDVTTFDGKPWKGIVDVVSGGFPCQDVALCGTGKGLKGKKSGLWKHMARIICEVGPREVFVENSADLATRGLSDILRDLAEMGYHAAWGVLGNSDLGGCHRRRKMWIYASNSSFERYRTQEKQVCARRSTVIKCNWGKNKSRICGVDDGSAFRVDRIKAIGNAQSPIVAATAFLELKKSLFENLNTKSGFHSQI